jgi:peptide/nickel transport system substrate-binding protein
MPEGGQTRQREDAPLTVRVLALDTAQNRRLVEAILSAWQAVGVTGQATYIAELTAYRQALAERAFDIALVDVAPPGDPDLYDFWSQEAIVRGQNYGGWNNRRASEALEAGRRLTNKAERLAQYESFLRQFDADLPALNLFQPVDVYALRDSVQRADVGRLDQPRDRYATFASWFMLYRDVAVNCPPSG